MIVALQSAETKKRAQEIKNETQVRWLLYAFANKELIPRLAYEELGSGNNQPHAQHGRCMDLVYAATVIFL